MLFDQYHCKLIQINEVLKNIKVRKISKKSKKVKTVIQKLYKTKK